MVTRVGLSITEFQRSVINETAKNSKLQFEYGITPLLRVFGLDRMMINKPQGCFVHHGLIILRSDPDRPDALNTKTLFHELAHSTADHLGRPIGNAHKNGNRKLAAMEEIIAESSARILMNFFGMNNPHCDGCMSAYIAQYSEGIELDAADWRRIEQESQRASQYILDKYIPVLAHKRMEIPA